MLLHGRCDHDALVLAERSARIDDKNNMCAHMNSASSSSPVALWMKSSLTGIKLRRVAVGAVGPSCVLVMTFQQKDGGVQ